MNCAEYWEIQGVDPLDAALSVSCPNAEGGLPSQGAMIVVFLCTFSAMAVM